MILQLWLFFYYIYGWYYIYGFYYIMGDTVVTLFITSLNFVESIVNPHVPFLENHNIDKKKICDILYSNFN